VLSIDKTFTKLFSPASLPGLLAIIAAVLTLLVYLAEYFGLPHPFKGNLEVVLGSAELVGWLFYGDNARSRLQLYSAGLPFAMIFNGAILWVCGFVLIKLLPWAATLLDNYSSK
jgi:hypothetical protein